MNIIKCVQKSPEWLAIRNQYLCASDAPAMLGLSKYRTRTQLLHEKATGITPEVDAATQRRFDDGHRAEELARVLVEEGLGVDLYPVTATNEIDGLQLLASFDGVTLDGAVAWENKLFNKSLCAAIVNDGDLPDTHWPQVEHQLLVMGGGKVHFTVSDGTRENTVGIWYESRPERQQQLIAGWVQFERDLAEYQHIEHIERPKAEVCIELPALFIHARGQITDSNMQAYGEALTAKLAEVRAIQLVTDADFSNAREAAKMFREQCKKLELAKEAMLSQTLTIGEAARMMDAWHEDLRITALELEKKVVKEDLAKKRVMVGEAGIAFSAHIEALEAETRPIQLNVQRPNFLEAIKGKRNYASMQDALDTALAQGKIEADAIAKDIRAKLKWFSENTEDNRLFPDLDRIIQKPFDDFTLTVKSRIAEHKQAEAAKMESERARIQAEEEAKAKAAQDALLSAERAKMEADVRAKAEEGAVRLRSIEAAEIHTQNVINPPNTRIKADLEAAAIEEKRKQAQVGLVKVLPMKIWAEKDVLGTVNIKMQHEGLEAFDFVQINYDYRYTGNAHQHALTQRIMALLGADVPNV